MTVKAQDGTELPLRVTTDTDVAGIADRSLVWPGMKLSALYQIPKPLTLPWAMTRWK
ncbi:MAG TPA: hypothetical protein VK479_02855 [Micropepsaceae bacterium]|nr:hypothetical protein [Micropepsaceae bacterium]